MSKTFKKQAKPVQGAKARITRRATKEQLQLDEKKQNAISDYFAWEKRSAQREFVLGQPLFSK